MELERGLVARRRLWRPRRGRQRAVRHDRPRALARREVALGGELRVSLHDGAARHAELAREHARGRQPRAHGQTALANGAAQGALETLAAARAGFECEQHVPAGRRIGPRSWHGIGA